MPNSRGFLSALALIAILNLGRTTSGAAQTQPVSPIVDFNSFCLMGGSSGGKWVKPEAIAPSIKGGERYRLYSLLGPVGTGLGKKAESVGVPCEDTLQVEVKLPPKGQNIVAVGGNWNAQPRLPRVLGNNQPVYVKAVGDFLKQNGIPNPKVKIKQVLRVDLEGDRVDEVLITATSYTNGVVPTAEAGDYSIVLLRKVVKGRAQTVLVAGDIIPKRIEFGAPAEYRVSAILDANGDRTMEIFVYGRYYEGEWSTIYRVNGTKVEEVLWCGCGV